MNSKLNAPSNRLRIVITGYILRLPLGGNAWSYLQFVLGLARLGHDVYYVEDSGESPYCCYDVERNCSDKDPSYGLKFTARVFSSVGLGKRWAYYDAHTTQWLGPCAEKVLHICSTADLLLRMPAMADSLRPWLAQIPIRVLIDTDPVFTQLRHLTNRLAMNDALRYTAYLTFDENMFLGTSTVPDDGFSWRPTRQPVVLDLWQATRGPGEGKFTTVMKWAAYAAGEYNGVRYLMKAESFHPYMDLPSRVDAVLEVAASGGTTPRKDLRKHGWALCDPVDVSRDLWKYQEYIRGSKAEFSVAKHGYVVTHSGWFSERSAGYLASGRPVLVQDTGFSDWMETGAGVIAFSTPEEAIEGIKEINIRYDSHSRSAREIADEYFDSGKILRRLIDDAFSCNSQEHGLSPALSGDLENFEGQVNIRY